MKWNRQREPEKRMSDVNMTPLIDISLTLVVILLLATPLAFESAIGVRETTPGAREGQSTEAARVEVAILSEDTVRVNRVTLPRDRMERVLQPLLDNEPRQVVIACGGGISHGTFVDVLDRTKQCGAASIAVSGR